MSKGHKPRRWTRWKPTTSELAVLEEIFEKETKFPNEEMVTSLAMIFDRDNSKVKRIKNWFQNRRFRSRPGVYEEYDDLSKEKKMREKIEKTSKRNMELIRTSKKLTQEIWSSYSNHITPQFYFHNAVDVVNSYNRLFDCNILLEQTRVDDQQVLDSSSSYGAV